MAGLKPAATALVADDEPLLRERLVTLLQRQWPALQVLAEARNGREAVAQFEALQPEIVFLDVQMPGHSGLDAARAIGGRAAIVFVTAFEQYAVQAFEQGAVDYLVKPFDEARLATTLERLHERLLHRRAAGPQASTSADGDSARLQTLLDQLAQRLHGAAPPPRLQWIRASVGPVIKLIPVEEVLYFKSDEKYTLVAWTGGEALIRRSLRELQAELDPDRFVQVHRSVLVALPFVSQVVRGDNETAELHLRGRPEVLPVSRSFSHRFRQM
jgi:DNA-binding LytR/AlgR family response regulator